MLSNVLIFFGLALPASAWRVLYKAQRERSLATSGPYTRIRHPQYAAFMLIMFGFLLQWPTLPTLLMFPVLVWMYSRLARTEERAAEKEFSKAPKALDHAVSLSSPDDDYALHAEMNMTVVRKAPR